LKIIQFEEFLEKWKNKRKDLMLTVIPETLDDLWHLFNIISREDKVIAQTTRESKVDERYARPKKGKRVRVNLGIRVENVNWDRLMNYLRVHGTVYEAPEELNVKGSHHTIKLALNKPLSIIKSRWRIEDIRRLERAQKSTEPPLIVVSIDDEEFCVTALKEFGVDVKGQHRVRLPGKLEIEKRRKAKNEFFKAAATALLEALGDSNGKIVILGPGFVKNEFVSYLKQHHPGLAAEVMDVKSVNNSGLGGIYEALRSGVLSKAKGRIRIAEETRVMEEVLRRLGKGKGDVTYGLSDVEEAAERGAVEMVLIADKILREADMEERNRIEELVKSVEEKGGRSMILSSEFEAGTELLSLGGIAALLRYPLSY